MCHKTVTVWYILLKNQFINSLFIILVTCAFDSPYICVVSDLYRGWQLNCWTPKKSAHTSAAVNVTLSNVQCAKREYAYEPETET